MIPILPNLPTSQWILTHTRIHIPHQRLTLPLPKTRGNLPIPDLRTNTKLQILLRNAIPLLNLSKPKPKRRLQEHHSFGLQRYHHLSTKRSCLYIASAGIEPTLNASPRAHTTNPTLQTHEPTTTTTTMGFGDLTSICRLAPLPLCPLIGHNPITNSTGIQPSCYARTINIANTIIFEGAASTIHILALIMTTIMLLHVRSKFTAVGRKEITSFFYLYMLLTVFSLVLDAGVVSPGSSALPWFVAVQIGLAGATCLSLLINGFVGFQIYEDGTGLSVWLLRGCSATWFFISFIVALLTFKGCAVLDVR